MTKTILTLLVTCYALARLVSIGSLYYLNTMRLPTAVVVLTLLCSLLSLLAAFRCYIQQRTGKLLRFALFVCGATALVNMILVSLAQPGTLTNVELLITGTVFDILLFAGSCTIKIRDNRGNRFKNPFTRMAHTDHTNP